MVNMTVWNRKKSSADFETRLDRSARKTAAFERLLKGAMSLGLADTASEIQWRMEFIRFFWRERPWHGKGREARIEYSLD